jgi:glycosyltransferase involved in cell wall biosynthesis
MRFLKTNNISFFQGHKRASLPYLLTAEKFLKIESVFNYDNIYLKYNFICSLISPFHIAYLSDVLKKFYMPYYSANKFNNVTINMGGTFYEKQSTEQISIFKCENGLENKVVLLSLGRLDNQKNHKFLFNALSKVKNNKFICLVVGDGILRKDLIAMASQMNLTEKVRFLGQRNDVENILNVADILIQSSIFEGFPNVFIEAASVALPIISTNVGSSETLVKNNGILVKSNDVTGLAFAIDNVISDYKSYKEEAILMSEGSFLMQFKKDEMLRNYISFYKTLDN